jgi:hypothetical protein
LQSVALHEFGHSLGLKHNPGIPNAVMNPYYNASRALHADDVLGIQMVYARFQEVANGGVDIAIGPRGHVFYISQPVGFGSGGRIRRWTGSGWAEEQNMSGVSLAVDSTGRPWHVNRQGELWGWAQNQFGQLPGRGSQLAISASNTIFHVTTIPVTKNGVFNGWEISQWSANGWQPFDNREGAICVALERNGTPWIVNSFGNIFRWSGQSWSGIPQRVSHLSIGANDTVIGVDPDETGALLRWNGSFWNRYPRTGATKVAVSPSGAPWHLNRYGQLFQPV